MDYSVVMSTLNHEKDIGKAIDSVFKQTIKPKEFIIMMDKASNTKNMDLLLKYKKKYPHIKIYYLKSNLGACALINIGVKIANAPFILNMDDDAVLINDNWVETALKNFRNNIGIVWGNISGCLDSRDYGEFFIGSVFLTKKEIFKEVGMFDEKFFIYENELDLTVRLNRYGYRILPMRKMRVFHPFDIKGPRFYEFALSNRLLIYWKYYPYWVSFIMTIFHASKELQKMRDYKMFKYWLRGIKRFFSKLHWIGLSYKNRMNMKEFFKHSYQLKFPAFSYKLIKFLYRH